MTISSFARYRNALERRLLPKSVLQRLAASREQRALEALPQRVCATASLSNADDHALRAWLAADLAAEWHEVERKMAGIRFGGGSGAVNPGDRRALYYLVRALRPKSVLEVGTHVGASTSMLALALQQNQHDNPALQPRLVSVDIIDVNDPLFGAWKRIECSHSPADVLRSIGAQDMITFVTSPSIPYLRNCKERFDLIFLDGDHAATAVYQEIPAALELLNPGGTILLHDYFPDLKPLWSDGAVVAGPALAMRRLRSEHVPIIARPFGAVPWPTKLGSNVSSLALASHAT